MIAQILLVVLLFILVGMFVAPLESLGWWSKSGLEDSQRLAETTRELVVKETAEEHGDTIVPEANHYLVYLSGIGVIDGDSLPPKEVSMVQALIDRLGDTKVITDVYPYSPENLGLTGKRPMAWLWRRLWRLKGTKAAVIAFVINIRNAMQMMVSVDSRYGPVYNSGVAQSIWKSLLANGYNPVTRKPVTLLGWSGGGQIAVGVAWYLASFGVPVYVLSMAGVVSSDAGLDRVEHMWHLYGTKDNVQKASKVVFVGRWKIAYGSAWNRAMRAGKIDMIPIGPLRHMGKDDYFDVEPPLPDGSTPFGISVEAIVKTLVDAGLATDLGIPDPTQAPPAQNELVFPENY